MALVENIQREDLNAMEVAITYQRLIEEFSLRHEDLAQRVGKKRTTITNFLRLLELPPVVQEAVKEDSQITFVQEAFDSLMNPDCTIRGELFLPDQIHMNQEGYRVWTDALEIYLEQPAAPQ